MIKLIKKVLNCKKNKKLQKEKEEAEIMQEFYNRVNTLTGNCQITHLFCDEEFLNENIYDDTYLGRLLHIEDLYDYREECMKCQLYTEVGLITNIIEKYEQTV